MLDKDYTEDFTKGVNIIHEFHVDKNKVQQLKYYIEESISSCTGLFSKYKKNRLKKFLEELDNIQDYYITENNYLFTFDNKEKLIKRVFDLGLSWDLSKSPHEYIKNSGDCLISALVESNGYGIFEKNEEGEYIGCFGCIDGTIGLTIWDIFKEDIYSILKKYIKEENVEVDSILPDFEL